MKSDRNRLEMLPLQAGMIRYSPRNFFPLFYLACFK